MGADPTTPAAECGATLGQWTCTLPAGHAGCHEDRHPHGGAVGWAPDPTTPAEGLTWLGLSGFTQRARVGSWLWLCVYPSGIPERWYWTARAGDQDGALILNAPHPYATAGAAKFAAHVEAEHLLRETLRALAPVGDRL
jgi:hypothetical protein